MFSLFNRKRTKSVEVKSPTRFVQFTRVYGNGKKQPFMISANSVESYRPRNKIEGNRCTLTTTSGKYINVAEKFSVVRRMLT